MKKLNIMKGKGQRFNPLCILAVLPRSAHHVAHPGQDKNPAANVMATGPATTLVTVH